MADQHYDERLNFVDAAAKRLGCSRSTIYRLIKSGELSSVTIGRSRRIAESDLRDFIDRHRASA